jgi:TolB-like protein/tetratricopeptide (TPR) repeat protein
MTDERAKRKMSAILSADVKDYSHLMSADEEGTVKDLNACREIIAGCIADHRGRVVDSPGDNVLAEFASTVEAVKCAVQIQKELKDRNADVPEDRRMEFRIGVNLGDVIEEEDRIYGDGVNIAARLEGLADAGGICISGTTFDQVKGKAIKIQDVAKELNVRYILEGSVQKSGDKVRIRAQLIDGQTDHHLWSESYDGVLNDIFDLQDKITGKIISALSIKISPSEQEKVTDRGTDNVFAYEALLKGEEQFIIQTPESFLKAIEYYKQALKFDPNYSRANAGIGGTYYIAGNLRYHQKMGSGFGTTRLLARKYLELAMKNPSPEAYALAAGLELQRRNFEKSLAFAEKAYNYSPNSANRQTSLAWQLAFFGRSEESIDLLNQAMRLDPVDIQKHTPICLIFIGINHFVMGNFEEAVSYLEKGLKMNPRLSTFSCFLAASHGLLGHDLEAQNALADYLNGFPEGFPVTIQNVYNIWFFEDSKVFDRLAQGLVKAGLPGDPANYYKLNRQEKLNGQEIKKLLFGKTSSGYAYGIKALKFSYDISENGGIEYSYKGKTYTGKAWIEGDNTCQVRENYHGGLKDCHEIYRNPEGDELAKTEYFRVTDYGLFLFSVDK